MAPILYHNIGDRVKRNHRRLSAQIYHWSSDPKPLQFIELITIPLQILELRAI